MKTMTLREIYDKATPDEWARLAEAAGVTPHYLGQVARGWRRQRGSGPKMRVRLSFSAMARLAAADKRLKVRALVAEMSDLAQEAA